jgi:hypothetical protein
MTTPYSITGIFSRLIEITKKKFNLTTSSETISSATKKASTPDTESAIRHIRNESDEVELRSLISTTAARLREQAKNPHENMVKDMELYAKNVDSIREEVMGVRLKKGDPGDLTEHEKELKVVVESAIDRLNDEHNKAVIRKQIELYGKSFAFTYDDQEHKWTLWPKSAEEYWRIAKEDFAAQRGEQETISPDVLATVAEITEKIIALRGKHSELPKGLIETFMFTEKKPYQHNIAAVSHEDKNISPVACRVLIRAKRDFDASIDTGEIYQIFMRLFSYLTLKERHLLYPVLCKNGPVVGIDDSTLSSISEVISNDDFCLKYKEIYDIFYSVK